MDIWKSFDSIPHELLILNVNVYELRMDVVARYSLSLKRRNQNARIDNTVVLRSSSFISWATVKQYIYYRFFYFYLSISNMDLLIPTAAIEGFKMNETMVNAYKFQVTVVKKKYKIKDSYPLNTINHMPSTKLLTLKTA